MINTKASRNKLIITLARKKSVTDPSSTQGHSSWELIHTENGK